MTSHESDAADNTLKIDLVQKQKCFSHLKNDEITILATLLQKRHYEPGETIVTEGEPVDSVYFIIHGTADVRHVYIDNNKETFDSIATLSSGQSIGLNETGFYSLSGLRTATVVAKTAIDAFRLSVPAFNGFALAHPDVNISTRTEAG